MRLTRKQRKAVIAVLDNPDARLIDIATACGGVSIEAARRRLIRARKALADAGSPLPTRPRGRSRVVRPVSLSQFNV